MMSAFSPRGGGNAPSAKPCLEKRADDDGSSDAVGIVAPRGDCVQAKPVRGSGGTRPECTDNP